MISLCAVAFVFCEENPARSLLVLVSVSATPSDGVALSILVQKLIRVKLWAVRRKVKYTDALLILLQHLATSCER